MRVCVRLWLAGLAVPGATALFLLVAPAAETGAQGPPQPILGSHKVAPLTMGWCVECHAARRGPLDCVICHH